MPQISRPTFDGLLNFYKPTRITSAKALYRVRKLTGIRKSGHAGTLDPAADGVLLICMGKATKRVESLMDLPKVYRAGARLDVTSASFDSDSPYVPVQVSETPSAESVRRAAAGQEGEIQQVPPAVSAIKIDGKPAYKRVRSGETPELQPRQVKIYQLTILSYAWPELEFEVSCGRGTYVRAIIRDLGVALGTGGCLVRLTRLAIGPFRSADAVTFDELEAGIFEQERLSLEQLDECLRSFRSV